MLVVYKSKVLVIHNKKRKKRRSYNSSRAIKAVRNTIARGRVRRTTTHNNKRYNNKSRSERDPPRFALPLGGTRASSFYYCKRDKGKTLFFMSWIGRATAVVFPPLLCLGRATAVVFPTEGFSPRVVPLLLLKNSRTHNSYFCI